MIFLIMENVMNQSDYFVGKQQEAYDYSLDILKGFGGTGIVKGVCLDWQLSKCLLSIV